MAGSDIEWRTSVGDDKTIYAPTGFRLIVYTGEEPVAHIVICAAPFVAEVKRIKRRAAGAVVSAAAVVQGVRSPESDFMK